MKQEKRIKNILEKLSNRKVFLFDKFGVEDLAVFGSYARNRETIDSDIDIYVELKKDYKTFDNFMELKFFLEELFDNRKVDLVTKESIRKELKPAIFEEAVHV